MGNFDSSKDIVKTNVDYTYERMERDIFELKNRYPFMETGVAGKSILGRNLYYIRLGSGKNCVFYNGAHHSLEWITSLLLVKYAEEFLKSCTEGCGISGYSTRSIWKKSSIYIIPMVNPDGVDLVLNGLKEDNPYYSDLIKWNGGRNNFNAKWQANIRGVDLNHNYPAKWNLSKDSEQAYGIYGPGPTRYSGTGPLSEPESRAVYTFTLQHDFRMVLAFHSQGEVIYWDFDYISLPEGRKIGELLANISGYKLDEPEGMASYAGFKDWFIQHYKRPGYTIEVGIGKNPLPLSQFSKIYNDNEKLLLLAALL